MTTAPGALDGVKVLDLSRWIAGPYCTMLMADMGADVIRVERPGGEDARRLPPFIGTESAYFLHYNRNKRAITLSTRDSDGQEVLRRLLVWADVLVQNFRPGTMEKMGLGADELEKLNPRLVVTAISGYGQTGPWSTRPLFNAVAEAASGLMALNGSGGVPMMTGNFTADHSAGLHAAFATMTALFERERSGRGQVVDVSLFESTLSIVGFPLTAALNGIPGIGVRENPNRDATAAPGDVYPTSDGRYVYIDAGTEGLYVALAATMGPDSGATDARFADTESRAAHVDELDVVITRWTSALTADQLEIELERAGVPHGVVQTLAETVEHPLIEERHLARTIEMSDGALRIPSPPIRLSRSPSTVRLAPPRVGADTDSVLAEICGLTTTEIKQLRDTGAI